MKTIYKIFVLTVVCGLLTVDLSSQVTTKIIGDTIKLYQTGGGTAELLLMNNTKAKTGAFLQNIGNGKTKFNYALDSVWYDLGQLKFRRGSTTEAFNFSELFDAVDSVYNRSDSLFYLKNGIEYWIGNLSGGGESTSAINLSGAGIGIFKTESGDQLQFKRVKSNYGLSITDATDSVLFDLDTGVTDLRYLRNTIKCGLTCTGCGLVTWSGTGLTFDISESWHNHDFVPYHTPAGSITLAVADATFGRFDAIGLTTSGIAKITGDPTSDPQLPQFDPCEFVLLTYVFVGAGATTPTLVTDDLIYDEDAGGEWAHTTSGTISANFASTAQFVHGAKSVAVASWSNNANIIFTEGGSVPINSFNTFTFWVRFTVGWSNNQNISVQFFNGTTAISTQVVATPVKSLTGTWQLLTMSPSQFTFISETFTSVRFILSGSGASTFYIDWVRLQSGVSQPASPSGLLNAYSRITDGSNIATAIGGDIFKIRTDATLTKVVTNNDPTHGDNVLLKVDTSQIATQYDLTQITSGRFGVSGEDDTPTQDRAIDFTSTYFFEVNHGRLIQYKVDTVGGMQVGRLNMSKIQSITGLGSYSNAMGSPSAYFRSHYNSGKPYSLIGATQTNDGANETYFKAAQDSSIINLNNRLTTIPLYIIGLEYNSDANLVSLVQDTVTKIIYRKTITGGGTPTLQQVLTSGNTYTNSGSGFGIDGTNSGSGSGIKISNTSSGNGIAVLNPSGGGPGVAVTNTGLGPGFYVGNGSASDGDGIVIQNEIGMSGASVRIFLDINQVFQITSAGLAKYGANYGSSYDSRTLVDKNYVDSSVTAGGSGGFFNPDQTSTGNTAHDANYTSFEVTKMLSGHWKAGTGVNYMDEAYDSTYHAMVVNKGSDFYGWEANATTGNKYMKIYANTSFVQAEPDSVTFSQASGIYSFDNVTTDNAVAYVYGEDGAGHLVKRTVASLGGGYTTLAQFVGESNWQNYYSNGSGDITSQTVGAANTVWLGNGVTSAPSWGTVPNAALTNSTISGISLGSNLADLTATDGTLTFSGTYNGSTARTIGLNLGNANTWTATQTFIDNVWIMQDNGDNTKQLQFQLSSITAGATRTLTAPDLSGTIAVTTSSNVWAASVRQTFGASGTRAGFNPGVVTGGDPFSATNGDLYYDGTGHRFMGYINGVWTAFSAGGSGTVNTGVAGKAAYYPSSTTTVDDFAAVDYATSGTNVLITALNTTDVPLEIKGISSQSANLLNISSSSGTGDLAIITSAGGSRFTSLIIGTPSARKIELFANGEALFTSDATANISDPDGFDNTTQIYGGGNARFLISSGSGYDHSLVAVTGNLFGTYTGFVDGGGIIMETNQALNLGTNKIVRAVLKTTGQWQLLPYGSGTFTGTATKFLAVDASGNIIEENAPGGSGHTIQEEGTPLTARANLNFIGSGFTAADDAGNNATTITLDADLNTWAGITPGSNVGTFLATPSSANLRSALTDENGTGAALFSGNTSAVFNTAVLDGAVTGTGVATAATASTLAKRDADANITANNWLGGYTTTATAAGTTTLTVSSTYLQYFTGSTTQTVTLPVTSTLTLGHQFIIVNNSTGNVTVNSSGGNAVIVLAGGTSTTVTCILTSGTTAASWSQGYFAESITSGKKLSVSNTMTLAGTDGQTYTFPSTSATIARTDAANTFTGVQTLSSAAVLSTGTVTVSGNTITFPGAAGTLATLAGTETLSGKTLTAPKFATAGFIADNNGNELIIFTTTASAVNEITLANGATGNNATITASGETNTGITITGKGTKGVSVGNAFLEKTSTVSDGAGAVIDASLGNYFTWTAAADRTAGTTTNPTAGQKMIIAFTASGGARTLTLPTATTGDFVFGSDITALSQTASGKTDLIGCIYNGTRWQVVAYTKGF